MTEKVLVTDLAQLIFDYLDAAGVVYQDPEGVLTDVGVEGRVDLSELARKIADEADTINRGWVWL